MTNELTSVDANESDTNSFTASRIVWKITFASPTRDKSSQKNDSKKKIRK